MRHILRFEVIVFDLFIASSLLLFRSVGQSDILRRLKRVHKTVMLRPRERLLADGAKCSAEQEIVHSSAHLKSKSFF